MKRALIIATFVGLGASLVALIPAARGQWAPPAANFPAVGNVTAPLDTGEDAQYVKGVLDFTFRDFLSATYNPYQVMNFADGQYMQDEGSKFYFSPVTGNNTILRNDAGSLLFSAASGATITKTSNAGGGLTIDVSAGTGSNGRDALFFKSAAGQDSAVLVTDKQKFLFWAQGKPGGNWATLQAGGLAIYGTQPAEQFSNGIDAEDVVINAADGGDSADADGGAGGDVIINAGVGGAAMTGGTEGAAGKIYLAQNGGPVCMGNPSSCITSWSQAGSANLWTKTGNNIYSNNSGNVGIGENNPGEKLELVREGNIKIKTDPGNDTTPSLVSYQLASREAGGGSHLWRLYTAPVGGGYGVAPNSFSIWDYPAAGDSNERLTVKPSVTGAKPSVVTIDPVGKVGIGDANPRGLLQVSGAPKTSGDVGTILEVKDTTANGSNTSYGGVMLTSNPGWDYSVGKKSVNNDTYFQVRRQDGKELLTIDKDGNLSMAPNAKLNLGGQRNYLVNYKITDMSTFPDPPAWNFYVLLHRAYDGSILNNYYAFGTIHGNRGSTGAWNRKVSVKIDSATAYDSTRGYVQSDFEDWKLVTLRYGGVKYLALQPVEDSSALSLEFTGWANASDGELLKAVLGTAVTEVAPYTVPESTFMRGNVNVKNGNFGVSFGNVLFETPYVSSPQAFDTFILHAGAGSMKSFSTIYSVTYGTQFGETKSGTPSDAFTPSANSSVTICLKAPSDDRVTDYYIYRKGQNSADLTNFYRIGSISVAQAKAQRDSCASGYGYLDNGATDGARIDPPAINTVAAGIYLKDERQASYAPLMRFGRDDAGHNFVGVNTERSNYTLQVGGQTNGIAAANPNSFGGAFDGSNVGPVNFYFNQTTKEYYPYAVYAP